MGRIDRHFINGKSGRQFVVCLLSNVLKLMLTLDRHHEINYVSLKFVAFCNI